MKKRLFHVAFAMLVLAGDATGAPTQQPGRRCQVMATLAPGPDGAADTILSAIYREAFRRIGHCLVVVRLPPARASMEDDLGMLDGELGRGASYGATHPALARVDEPAVVMRLSAYVRDPGVEISGWNGLRSSPYYVEYRLGIEAARQGAQAVVQSSRLSSVPSARQGLKKLAVGRTDVYIDFDEHVGPLLQPDCTVLRRRITRAGTLQVLPIHAYLSRHNTALATRLSAALKGMRDEGLLASYAHAAESQGKACR